MKGHRPLAVMLALAAAGGAAAVDPFYENLVRKGWDDYNRGAFTAAVRALRIGCFGLLDEPAVLADGLIRLALAQAKVGDAEGFRDSFRRIVEVEQRFKGYTSAPTGVDERTAFEQQVTRLVAVATLAATPAFAHLLPKPEDRVTGLPARERRKELERLAKASPDEVVWRAMLAELELGEGNVEKARKLAEAALKSAPSDQRGLRVYGLVMVEVGQWAQAVRDLEASGAAQSDPRVAAGLLRALLELGRAQEAHDLYTTLPREISGDGQVRAQGARAAAQVEPDASGAAGSPLAAPPAASSQPEPTALPEVGTPAAPAPAQAPALQSDVGALPAAATKQLDKARELARQGKAGEAFELARSVADAFPDSREAQLVAAEMAYRMSRWPEALGYFRRGGDPGDAQPSLLFYLAVVRYENGDRAAAAEALERCLPRLRRTQYVDEYIKKILP